MEQNIPSWAQSSVDPTQVSLFITSAGKAVSGLIVFLGVIGVVDPVIAGQTWSAFVASTITALTAGWTVWHTGYAVWGLVRKAGVRLAEMVTKTPIVPPSPDQQS